MKMSELILAVGDEHVRFQNLMHGDLNADLTKHGTKLTFYTDAITPADIMNPDGCKTIALVLWLPKDRVDAALRTAAQQPATRE
ncbi:MAG: hypothetical protein A4E20_11895 [Nitrospira sp. SG-bin2]|uniref:hypothetical protein n=1 Tax=Nitrospira cf. moscoviensis SBR1015 TaxID=96242 RepID=UPI000A0E4DF0|nr:hypothetical protein [Nitrospira cf. moscoviensis SBR1015]OQW34130.1 MAG: hypothetical protein A4E20_11895 [Nitrospira sp. SG-bin2]